jgi:hypothetical protein
MFASRRASPVAGAGTLLCVCPVTVRMWACWRAHNAGSAPLRGGRGHVQPPGRVRRVGLRPLRAAVCGRGAADAPAVPARAGRGAGGSGCAGHARAAGSGPPLQQPHGVRGVRGGVKSVLVLAHPHGRCLCVLGGEVVVLRVSWCVRCCACACGCAYVSAGCQWMAMGVACLHGLHAGNGGEAREAVVMLTEAGRPPPPYVHARPFSPAHL